MEKIVNFFKSETLKNWPFEYCNYSYICDIILFSFYKYEKIWYNSLNKNKRRKGMDDESIFSEITRRF